MPYLHRRLLTASANYVSGGTRSGDVVTWAVASLADSSTSVQLVVTATQTITNDAYRATADGNLSAVGEVPAVTYVGQPVTKYYYLGSTRIAMRRGDAVYYLHGDHPSASLRTSLGSTSLTTDAIGGSVAQSRYLPYGQERWITGTLTTDFTFTGQRADLYTHLIEMGARWYDPYLNRWISADTIVPQAGNPQVLNRYSYANANPAKYNDPTGHDAGCGGLDCWDFAHQPSASDRLSSEVEGYIKQYAPAYGVPWQVVAGVMASEVKLDTTPLDKLENFWFGNAPSPLPEISIALARPNPGPGIGNVHVATAQSVSKYFADYYSTDPRVPQLNLHDQGTSQVARRLVHEEVNIQVTTAYVRQLADYRFGSNGQPLTTNHSDLSDWSITDTVATWHGYRYGVPGVSPGAQGFEALAVFQDRSYGLNGLMSRVRGPNAQDSADASIGIFRLYLNLK